MCRTPQCYTYVFLSVRPSVLFPRACMVALRRPLRLMSVTLSLPDAKMLGRLYIRCLDVTSAPYTFESCRWELADETICTRKKRGTQTSKREHFSKWVNMFNWHSCAPSTPAPQFTQLSTIAISIIYINSIWNFDYFGVSNSMMCNFFDPPTWKCNYLI
jgi:hypothetical protein